MMIKKPRVNPNHLFYHYAKRILDLAVCILILPFVLPIMIICAIIIYFDSPGQIIFIQERIGKGGRRFRLYKFRTINDTFDKTTTQEYMKAYVRGTIEGYDDGNEIYKPIKEGCISKVGRFLRKTSLDELPQIFNVIKGEMSIVGPRPNVPWEVEEYRPWHHERFEVLPGITGLAQVHGRSCIDFKSLVRFDIEYIENQSLWLDIKILWLTFIAVLKGEGAT